MNDCELFYYLWWLHTGTCKYYHLQNFVHFDIKYSKEYHILQGSLIQIQFEITCISSSSVNGAFKIHKRILEIYIYPTFKLKVQISFNIEFA